MGTYACTHTSILDSRQDKLRISQEVPDYLLPLKCKAQMTIILGLKLLNNSNRAVSKLLYLQIFWLQCGCNTKAKLIPLQSWWTLILIPWQFWKQIADIVWMRLQQEEEKNNDCYPKDFRTLTSHNILLGSTNIDCSLLFNLSESTSVLKVRSVSSDAPLTSDKLISEIVWWSEINNVKWEHC